MCTQTEPNNSAPKHNPPAPDPREGMGALALGVAVVILAGIGIAAALGGPAVAFMVGSIVLCAVLVAGDQFNA